MLSEEQSSSQYCKWLLTTLVIWLFITSVIPLFIVPNYDNHDVPNSIEYSLTSRQDDYELGVYLESDIGIACSDTNLWYENTILVSFLMNATLDTRYMETIQLEVVQIQIFLDIEDELVFVENIMGDNLTMLETNLESKDYGLVIESNLTEPIWDLYFQHMDDNYLLQTKLEFKADLKTTSEKTNSTWTVSSYQSFGIGGWRDKDLRIVLDAPWVRFHSIVGQILWVIPLLAILLFTPFIIRGVYKGLRRTTTSWITMDQPIQAVLFWSAITLLALYGAIYAIASYTFSLITIANYSVGSFYSLVALAITPPMIISIFIVTYGRGGEDLRISIRQQVISLFYFVYFLILSFALGYCPLAHVINSIRIMTILTSAITWLMGVLWISLNRYHTEVENQIASNTRWELTKIMLGLLVTGISILLGSALLF